MQSNYFINKVQKSKVSDLVHIIAHDDNERRFHIFILLDDYKFKLLDKRISNSTDEKVDFSEYGRVIATCYGMFPTEQIRIELKEKYDVDV